MEFDRFSLVFLLTNPTAPVRSESEDALIQDAHMSHLSDLHEAGHLLAAGPIGDLHYRGVCLFQVDVEKAQKLMETDPAFQAGWFTLKAMTWMVPGGAMNFSHTQFPRSISDLGKQKRAPKGPFPNGNP